MSRALVLLFASVAIAAQVPAAETSPTPKALAASVLRDSSLPVSGENDAAGRAQMVSALKKALSSAPSHEERVTIRAALVRLEDDAAISTQLRGFASSKSPSERAAAGEVFKLAHTPYVIPRMVEYVFFDDRMEHIETDSLGVERKSCVSARVIVELLSTCPEFTSRVHESAKASSVLTSREMREKIRQWWPKNRLHFEHKEYKSVGPL